MEQDFHRVRVHITETYIDLNDEENTELINDDKFDLDMDCNPTEESVREAIFFNECLFSCLDDYELVDLSFTYKVIW